MISRIRLEGHAATIEECKKSMHEWLEAICRAAPVAPLKVTQEVYSTNWDSQDGNSAVEGRMVLHAPIS